MTCLILLRAREVLTSDSQSLLGWWPGWVRISTTSPLRSTYLQRNDAAVDLGADAGVADFGVDRRRRNRWAWRRAGSTMTRPFGVKV